MVKNQTKERKVAKNIPGDCNKQSKQLFRVFDIMARDYSKAPISLREGLAIIAIFLIIFSALFKFLITFYLGIFIIIVLIIERFFGTVFNPGKSKVNLE